MKVKDLIELLKEMDQDADVRLAMQPGWPFEYNIDQVLEVDDEKAISKKMIEDVTALHAELGIKTGTKIVHTELEGNKILCWDSNEKEHSVLVSTVDMLKGVNQVVYLSESNQIGYLPSNIKEGLGW